MPTFNEAVDDFLAQRCIAVVGVSRDAKQPANFVARKLRSAGREVFAVNPAATKIEGAACFPSLSAIPGGVDAVLVFTPPHASAGIVRECAALGVRRVWLHRSFGGGSHSDEAVQAAHEAGITLIPAGCPAMFCAPVDPAHACFRWLLRVFGRLPKSVG
jgi:uncharacterized protein